MKSLSIAAVVMICIVLPGCGGGRADFKNVLVCLSDREEVVEYKLFVERYAESNGYSYEDNAPTRMALDARGNEASAPAMPERQSIYSVMESSSGLYVSISNWDHSETDLAHGFLARSTSDIESAKALASRFLAAVNTKWDVIELPIADNYWPTSCEDAREKS